MIELRKDKKSTTYILTTQDGEGFHRQINLKSEDLDELVRVWNELKHNSK